MGLKRFRFVALALLALSLTSCECSSDTQYVEDENYWNSMAREQMLKDMGMEEAARMERDARLRYMRGEGYTSPNGGQQVHYKGSAEQQADLDAIDAYMREHPDF